MPNLDRDYYLDKQGLQTLVNELETNIVAEEFSTSATYDLGDYCIYNNLLYVCIVPISTAGSWTGNTNWLQVLLADEVSEKTEIQTITSAQWEALTPEQKASGDYVISDATLSPLSASLMPYDNTTSGLTALTDVKLTSPQNGQELVYDNTLTSPYKWENRTTRVELTQAQYDALANPLPDVDYYITDAPSMQGSAQDLSYDGTITSTYAEIEDVKSDVSAIDNDLSFKRLTFVVPIDAISAGQSKSITATAASYTIPTGYTPVSYYVQYCYGTNTRYLNIWSCTLDATGSSTFIEVQNIGSGATTSGSTITLVVLFVKSSRVSTT